MTVFILFDEDESLRLGISKDCVRGFGATGVLSANILGNWSNRGKENTSLKVGKE